MNIPPSTDLVRTLEERASLAETLGDPNVTLARAAIGRSAP